MFNPNSESLTSTGEPPTEDGSRNNMSSASSANQQEMSSLSILEPDSGYEASPSSIADNQRFFSEQSVNRQSNVQRSTEEFDIVQCHSQILFSESESDEVDDYDTCLDCSSSQISCNCHSTDSSTNATAMNNCDNSTFRPSSQPIQIPMSSCRVNAQLVIGSPVSLGPLTRSQPIDLCPLQRLNLLPERHPLSWPSLAAPFRHLNLALTPPRSNNANIIRRNNHPVRNRRQLIDSEYSDASSYSSSDDEGLEDVFHMPAGEASSYPTASITMGSSVPLPDVVLQSTDSGRRGRSMSVNLPPDSERHVREIGQNLRRMSDQFQQRHQVRVAMRARSRTTSDCDHLRRNGLS